MAVPRKQADEEKPPTQAAQPHDSTDLPPGQIGTVVDSELAAASAQEDPDHEIAYVVSDEGKDAGKVREIKTRRGYAPAPLPFGYRPATDEEIAEYKRAQGDKQ
jgi:hypothetical protein